MKNIYFLVLLIISGINVYSQKTNTTRHKTAAGKTAGKTHKNASSYAQKNVMDTIVQPRETVTEKYLNGSLDGTNSLDTSARKTTGKRSPFAVGVHAAPDAKEKFDTVNSNQNANNTIGTTTAAVTPVAAPNDTIFNNNTATDNNVNTNSGAIDRSGNAQFGQSNWGNSRSTVGESEWTVPPPVTASFTKEFPTARNAIWSRNGQDSTTYSARYKSGDTWITSNYSAAGERLDMRSEVPMGKLPLAVSNYVSKIPTDLKVTTISKWQVLGKPDVYEIKTLAGKTFYVNSEGTEATF